MTKYMLKSAMHYRRRVYHTDKECNRIKTEVRPVSDHDIEALDLRECKFCAGEVDNSNNDFSYQRALKQAGNE